MKTRTKFIHEGQYVAEVTVQLIEDDSEWSPYVSLDDMEKLQAVQAALRAGDVQSASRYAAIYTLTPVK